MKAILIDAKARTVTEVEYSGNYRDIYTLLSGDEPGKVDLFSVIQLGDGDAVYLDDEGLLKPQEHFFRWKGFDQPLAGNGLILGTDDDGESTSPKIALEAVKEAVSFHIAADESFDPKVAVMDQTDRYHPRFVSYDSGEDFLAALFGK